MKKKILFLDRDGNIIVEPPEDFQVDSFEKLAFLPGAIRNLYKIATEFDYEFVMVTNQDGLGTEVFPEDTFWPVHNKMLQILENEGVQFKEVIIDRTFKKDKAPTRKPGTALLTHYMTGEYDLANSLVIGDRPSDVMLAKNLGAKGILLGKSVDNQDDEHEIEDALVLHAGSWDEIYSFLKNYQGRAAFIHRTTKETDIKVRVNLDGTGKANNQTGLGFFDHMLDQLAKHSKIDISIEAKGDLHIDPHHTIEDTGLALGETFLKALGDKRGIERYGCFNLAMDEALSRVAIDFSGRPWMVYEADIAREKVGDMPVEMVEHFFKSFSDTAKCTLNIETKGENAHHMIEATFKGVARAVRAAVSKIEGDTSLPSTKGIL